MSNDEPIFSESKQNLVKQYKDLQRHYELILQSAGEGIYGLDCHGHTTFANRAAADMIGWELEDLVGKSQHAILHHSLTARGTTFRKRMSYICCF